MNNENNKKVLISDYFGDNIFRLFRDYCNVNKIKYVDELENYDFYSMMNLKGLGITKILKIIKKCELFFNHKIPFEIEKKKYNIAGRPNRRLIRSAEYFKNIQIHSDFADRDIELFLEKDNFLHQIIINVLNSKNITKFKDLTGLEKNDFHKAIKIGDRSLNCIRNFFIKFTHSFKDFLKSELEEIKNHEDFYLYDEILTGITKDYMSLSKKYPVHISSVQRHIHKAEKKIGIYLKSLFTYLIENDFKDKQTFYIDDLKSFYDNEKDFEIISYYMRNNPLDKVLYFNEIDKFFIKIDFDIENIKKIMDEFIYNLPKVINFTKYSFDLFELLKSETKLLIMEDVERYFYSKGFKKENNCLLKKDAYSVNAVNLIINTHFKDGIELTDENVKKLNEIATEQFEIKRPVRADMIRYRNILKGRNIYTSIENVTINYALMHKIKDFINNEFEKINILSAKYLFNIFKDELIEKMGVDNKFYLYGVLHYWLSDEFDFKRYFVVKKDFKEIKTIDVLEKYILKENKAVSIEQVIVDLKLDIDAIRSITAINKHLFIVNNFVYHINFINISDNLKQQLKILIDTSLKEGYTNSKIIFDENEKYLTENGIKDDIHLFYILKYSFKGNYIFKIPHIFAQDYETHDNYNTALLIQKYTENTIIFSFTDLKKEFEQMKITNAVLYTSFKTIEDKFFQISVNQFMLKEKFFADEKAIKKVKTEIESLLKGKQYLALMDGKIYKSFPELPYEEMKWNGFLLKVFVTLYFPEYKILHRKNCKSESIRMILVRKDSPFLSVSDVVLYVVNNEYPNKENITRHDLKLYLIKKNIINLQIPTELITNNLIVFKRKPRKDKKSENNTDNKVIKKYKKRDKSN